MNYTKLTNQELQNQIKKEKDPWVLDKLLMEKLHRELHTYPELDPDAEWYNEHYWRNCF